MASDDVVGGQPYPDRAVNGLGAVRKRLSTAITVHGRRIVVGYPVALLVLFAVVPAGIMLITSFFPKPSGEYYSVGFTLNHYQRIFEGQALGYVSTTLFIAAITAIVCLVLAFPMAYGLSRFCSRAHQRNYLLVIIATMWLTVIIRTYAIQILYSSSGIFNRLLLAVGVVSEPVLGTTGLFTVISGMVYGFLPFALLTIYASINEVDSSLEEASLNLGANRLQTVWRIIVPQAAQGVALAGGLVFILASGSYVVPRLLGDPGQWTVPVLITQQISDQLNVPFAAALSITFVVIVDGLFLIGYWLYKRLGAVSSTDPDGQSTWSKIEKGGTAVFGAVPDKVADRLPLFFRAYLWGMLVLFVLPLIVVISVSFSPSSFMRFPPSGISLQWYESIATSASWRSAIGNSLLIATFAAILATSIGASLAYAIDRFELRFSSQLTVLGIIPLVIPPVIVGVAHMSYFLQLGIWGTRTGVVIAHGVIFSPFAFALVRRGLLNIDEHLEEAAAILGANQRQVTRTITLPLLASSLFSGALFSFVLSLNEYIIAFFLSGFGFNTVPVEIFASLRYNYSPDIAAISVLYIVLTTIVVYVLDRRFTLSLWD